MALKGDEKFKEKQICVFKIDKKSLARRVIQFLVLILKQQGQGLLKFCITVQYHER